MKKLLLTFFRNERFPGWKNIAEKLIESGECIVAGQHCIWQGGIGNFITTKNAEEAINCLKYTFDSEEFKKSAWFKEIKESYLRDLEDELEEAKEEVSRIEFEIKEIK